ncbi:hypothetical protein [Streptomyces sp. ODS28]|uniref:hypothetical protein n=1 Tax=Streptomyces sp. ODS28 TaxID=3136688 RepID=UPI0031EB2A2A
MTQPGQHAADKILALAVRANALPDVRAEVEANHDHNTWWPTAIRDWRTRMLAAGWSTRINYRMVGTYTTVLRRAAALGFDTLATIDDDHARDLVAPLGLPDARISYLRSLAETLARWDREGTDLTSMPADELIAAFAEQVHGASFKVAQCAVLYARGYHCGIVPVDSGMVTKLAPALGFDLSTGPTAHEEFRRLLEDAADRHADTLRQLAVGRRVTIPASVTPTWWTHLTLIYFKRLYLNRPPGRLCPHRPLCAAVTDCQHAAARAGST